MKPSALSSTFQKQQINVNPLPPISSFSSDAANSPLVNLEAAGEEGLKDTGKTDEEDGEVKEEEEKVKQEREESEEQSDVIEISDTESCDEAEEVGTRPRRRRRLPAWAKGDFVVEHALPNRR